MDDVINEVIYRCQEPFQAPQGSRIKYCDRCMLKRIKSGKKQEKKGEVKL